MTLLNFTMETSGVHVFNIIPKEKDIKRERIEIRIPCKPPISPSKSRYVYTLRLWLTMSGARPNVSMPTDESLTCVSMSDVVYLRAKVSKSLIKVH